MQDENKELDIGSNLRETNIELQDENELVERRYPARGRRLTVSIRSQRIR